MVQLHLDKPDTQVWHLVFTSFPFPWFQKTTHRRKKSFADTAHSAPLHSAALYSVPLCCTPLCSALLHGAHGLVNTCNSINGYQCTNEVHMRHVQTRFTWVNFRQIQTIVAGSKSMGCGTAYGPKDGYTDKRTDRKTLVKTRDDTSKKKTNGFGERRLASHVICVTQGWIN